MRKAALHNEVNFFVAEQINHYDANNIQVLEGLEAVRRRPGMYIGSTDERGLHHLVYEIVDNAIDEAMAGVCDTIGVTIEEDNTICVTDNGRGIPTGIHPKLGRPAVVYTVLHAGGKFGGGGYKVSGGLHGVGLSVVNALSEWLEVTVYQNGSIYRQEYTRGVPQYDLKIIGQTDRHGTTVRFRPDAAIFDDVTAYSFDTLKKRLRELAFLNAGIRIELTDKRGEGQDQVFHYEGGIRSFIEYLNKNREVLFPEPLFFSGVKDGTAVEVSMQYNDSYTENVFSFANNIDTVEGGTHLEGFRRALTRVINDYGRKAKILKDSDANLTGDDIREGLTAVVSVKLVDPQFEGQTKTKLDNQDAARATGKVMSEQLVLYFDRNLETLKTILSCAEKAAKIRKTEERAKTNLLTKQKYSFDSNGKLANCEKKDPSLCEIFIVEGDSAGGSAKTARDRNYQAILPIRGKILNVEKATIDKVLANAEIKTMINAFGCGFSEGYGNDFDITKLRYDKIVIMADADVDGAHISTLLLTLFYRFMPELIYEGHVYIAMPPLYKVMPKKGAEEYLYDDKALEKYRRSHKPGSFTLQRYKGLGEMDAQQLWETTLNPETRRMKRVEIEDARMASSVTEILMGSDVPPRKAFIYEHATDAELDI